MAAVRSGLARVVPVPLLSLFSGYELETMVCGSPDIPLDLLKSVAVYKGTYECVVGSVGNSSSYRVIGFFLRLREIICCRRGRHRYPRTVVLGNNGRIHEPRKIVVSAFRMGQDEIATYHCRFPWT